MIIEGSMCWFESIFSIVHQSKRNGKQLQFVFYSWWLFAIHWSHKHAQIRTTSQIK